ncbi:MAG: AMP-binding protein [Candidatus Lokiarchaeota archaeon]|nr:AMP-binding protein [Candidatus Lokiarchaeota archaeon]MBD3342875.1 AMP-binding protein [Candidatus Lokiarchaeota archaeon]
MSELEKKNVYESRFWKKNWDPGLEDIDPKEFETTYPEMIKETFVDFADKPAFSYLGVEVTFKELDEYSNQFANMLMDNGFKKGDVVGINLPNSPQYLIGLIGTLKAGCIVSGVSPLLSAVQIQYQLNDLGSGGKRVGLLTLDAIFEGHITKIASKIESTKLVVATNVASFLPKIKQVLGKLLGKVPKGKVEPIPGKTVLDFHKDILDVYPTVPVNVDIKPGDVGWIQYTGGTTGPPKGAMLTHRNCVSNILSIIEWLQWERGKGVMLSGFPMFHIAGLTVTEAAVFAGWTQILIPNPRDTDHICKEMKKYQVTNLVNVPSLYQMLIKNPKFKELDHSELGVCVSAASPFPKESQVVLESIIGKGKLLELYGMTETSPVSTMNPSIGEKKLGTVGMPFLNVELKIVDPESGEPVPLGQAGEICVKGPLVMKGYYNKPEETEKAIDKDGYMHTGDVGIMDEDGYVRIVDRTKDMIIVGGYKVFSSKVEDVLSKHPAVGMIALIGLPNPDRPGSEIVKAYIQLDPDYEFDGDKEAVKEDFINFAREKCAPYEVPKQIEITEEIPLTAVGKIDKKVLRAEEKK